MRGPNDFKSSMEAAKSTLEHLKKNALSATPRHYELMYAYVTGANPAITWSIDDILAKRGRISEHEISAIFDEFIAPDRMGQKIEEISYEIGDEIDKTITLLTETSESNRVFSAALSKGKSDLSQAAKSGAVDEIVGRLSEATTRVDTINKRLADQLNDARRHIADLQQTLESARFDSLTDDLTTLHNRKHFDHTIARSVREAERDGKPFSLLMVDIDHFKSFNDTFGHQTGDQVLRLVALSLKQTIKGGDTACRYGGEEFAIILPQTPLGPAATLADKIRNAVMSKELVKRSTGENLGKITISLGVAMWSPGDQPTDLIARADRALYAAKRGGRNTIRRECDPDVSGDERVA